MKTLKELSVSLVNSNIVRPVFLEINYAYKTVFFLFPFPFFRLAKGGFYLEKDIKKRYEKNSIPL